MLRIIFHNLIFKKTNNCLDVIIRNVRPGRILKRTASDPEDNQRENILYDPVWSNYESLQDLEDDQQAIFNTQNDKRSRQQIVKREREILKKKILLKKHFKPVREAPLLTWEAMAQIKYLSREYPDEWTLDKLEESFPVSKNAIIRILKRGNRTTKLYEIKKHNTKVRRHWKALQSGDFWDDKHLVAAYNNLKKSNKFSLLVNAAGIKGIPTPLNINLEPTEFDRQLALPGGITTKELRVNPFTSILQKYKAWPLIDENSNALDENDKEANKNKCLEELKTEGLADKKLLASITEVRARDGKQISKSRLPPKNVHQNNSRLTYRENSVRVNEKTRTMYGRDTDAHDKHDVYYPTNGPNPMPEMISPTMVPDRQPQHKKETMSRGDVWNELIDPFEPSQDLFSREGEGYDKQTSTDIAISNSEGPSRNSSREKQKKLMLAKRLNDKMVEQEKQGQDLTAYNLDKLQMLGTFKISKHQLDADHTEEQVKDGYAPDGGRTVEGYEKYDRSFYGDREDVSTPRKKYFSKSKRSYKNFCARSYSESEVEKRQLENAGFAEDNDEKNHEYLVRKYNILETEDGVERRLNGQESEVMSDMNDKSKSTKTITQKKQNGSSFYRVGQCVYDEDNEFLYKIP